MRASCVITNFNYAPFLPDALNSVFNQVEPFAEIIVVDDFSTDESIAVLEQYGQLHTNLQIVRHERNLGQLAAFASGFNAANGDVICFLDADDIYAPTYLKVMLEVYKSAPDCDFLFCKNQVIARPADFSPHVGTWYGKLECMGRTVVQTLAYTHFIGEPTSCLSLKRSIADKIFPIPYFEDWKTRADDCLVFGASLAGAKKYKVAVPLVGYRQHPYNAYLSNSISSDADTFFRREVALIRLFLFFRNRFGLSADTFQLAHLEFKTCPSVTIRSFLMYLAIVVKVGARNSGRGRAVGVMLKHYLHCYRLSRGRT